MDDDALTQWAKLGVVAASLHRWGAEVSPSLFNSELRLQSSMAPDRSFRWVGAISTQGINLLPYIKQPVGISQFPYNTVYRTPRVAPDELATLCPGR